MTQQPPPRMISMLRDRDCIGFLTLCGPRGVKAYDSAGEPLGYFADEHAAARIDKPVLRDTSQQIG